MGSPRSRRPRTGNPELSPVFESGPRWAPDGTTPARTLLRMAQLRIPTLRAELEYWQEVLRAVNWEMESGDNGSASDADP